MRHETAKYWCFPSRVKDLHLHTVTVTVDREGFCGFATCRVHAGGMGGDLTNGLCKKRETLVPRIFHVHTLVVLLSRTNSTVAAQVCYCRGVIVMYTSKVSI